MRKYLLVVGVAGLSILPIQAGAWGGFRAGGFHEGPGGFTAWHGAGWGGGGWGGAYHADWGGATHVGYGGVTHVDYGDAYHGAYYGGTYYHPNYAAGGCWGCVSHPGAVVAAGAVGLATGAAIGSAVTASTESAEWSRPVVVSGPAIGSEVVALPGGCGSVFAAGTRYYNCGSAYYQPHFGSNGVYYTVVPAPS